VSSTSALDIRRFIDDRPVSRYQLLVAVMCGLIVFVDGFDAQAMGYVAPALTTAMKISRGVLASVISSGLVGMMIGALVSGPLADRIGRKPVLIGCSLIFGIGSLLTTTAQSVESLMAWLQTALPDEKVVEQTLLTEYDDYYYSRGSQTPLPVLRVKYADPAQSWIYVDPEMSRVLGSVPKLARVERWLYNGLHSLDFKFWYSRRPLWDIGMIVLLLGGLASSAIGAFLGARRLARASRRAVGSIGAATPVDAALRHQAE